MDSAALGEVDGGTEAVGRKASTTSKTDRFGHIGLLKRPLSSPKGTQNWTGRRAIKPPLDDSSVGAPVPQAWERDH